MKFAIAPIGWSNDDMPEIGAHISFEQCIREMSEAGFSGCEVGHKFPRDPDTLKKALTPLGLEIASAWYSLFFTEAGRASETISGFVQHMNFLKAMGAKVIVVCECGNGIVSKPLPILKEKPHFSDHQWQQLIDGLHHLGDLARQNDMHIVYHHHMGTGIENQADIERLMHETDPDRVSLLLDTGHLTYAGCNPMLILNKYSSRIRHVHLKDIRANILKYVDDNNLSFRESVMEGVFTVPGDGCIDFKPIFHTLREMNYRDWGVVEAEQDPLKANPLQYAKMAMRFLTDSMNL